MVLADEGATMSDLVYIDEGDGIKRPTAASWEAHKSFTSTTMEALKSMTQAQQVMLDKCNARLGAIGQSFGIRELHVGALRQEGDRLAIYVPVALGNVEYYQDALAAVTQERGAYAGVTPEERQKTETIIARVHGALLGLSLCGGGKAATITEHETDDFHDKHPLSSLWIQPFPHAVRFDSLEDLALALSAAAKDRSEIVPVSRDYNGWVGR